MGFFAVISELSNTKKVAIISDKNLPKIIVKNLKLSLKNYEVKIDLFEKFISQDKNNESFFNKINSEKYFFDLRGFINKELSNLNIKNVDNIEMDTFSEKEFFYSYRRSRLNREQDYGRCISVILMT